MSIYYKIYVCYIIKQAVGFSLNKCMELKKQLGKRIRELRELKGFSQEYMAEQLNMHHANYWRIENGTSYPKAENLEKISSVLNVKINEIFSFEHINDLENIRTELKNIIENNENLTLLIYKFVKTLEG